MATPVDPCTLMLGQGLWLLWATAKELELRVGKWMQPAALAEGGDGHYTADALGSCSDQVHPRVCFP